jgi:hypothetical protein
MGWTGGLRDRPAVIVGFIEEIAGWVLLGNREESRRAASWATPPPWRAAVAGVWSGRSGLTARCGSRHDPRGA